MLKRFITRLLPDRPVRSRIWRGPFRGAHIMMNPRHSLRKTFGLYEHELNTWIEAALLRVDRVIDVGANDGYFTFGCAAAFKRLDKAGAIIAFEPQERHVRDLQASIREQNNGSVQIQIIQALTGSKIGDGITTLDALEGLFGADRPRTHTLIKIDVEGAELDVIAGAKSWLQHDNAFVIEVHQSSFRDSLINIFAGQGIPLKDIYQQPIPLLGRELRDAENSWLVSDLSTR